MKTHLMVITPTSSSRIGSAEGTYRQDVITVDLEDRPKREDIAAILKPYMDGDFDLMSVKHPETGDPTTVATQGAGGTNRLLNGRISEIVSKAMGGNPVRLYGVGVVFSRPVI